MTAASQPKSLLEQVMETHLKRLDEATAKAPNNAAEVAAMGMELKQLVVSMMASLSTVLASTVTATAAPMMAAAAKEAQQQANASVSAELEQRVQSIIDEGVSRMQALTARVMDVLVEDRKQDALESKQEAAERKLLLAAVAALAKPRKRTGVVKLPSGSVEMTVTETVQ